jgi:tetratricopeptide (TPR) repeat protein
VQVKISTWSRIWEALKPPPAVPKNAVAISPQQRKRRRRIITLTLVSLAMIGVGSGVYLYISSAPKRAEVKLQEGMRRAAAGDFTAAVGLFNQALEIWPDLTPVYLQRALAYQGLNHQDLAKADLQQATIADPTQGAAHVALGSIYRQQGDSQRAMNEFGLAIKLSGDMDAYYQRGQIYESQGEHQKAIDDYDAAISLMRDAPYMYLARAASRDQLGDHDGAEEDRQRGEQLQHHIIQAR